MTRFGYYLLLSNSSIKLNSFKKYYYNMLSYFSKDFESMYKKFISSHLVSYNNKNNTIKLIDINFEHFLHVNYRNFIIKERNKKIEGLIPKEPITDIISLINLVINHLNITSKPIITQTGYISKSIVNKILNDIPNYISGELNENQYLVIIEFLIQLLFQSDFIKISMERTLIITNTYFEFITMSKNNKMKHLSDNYQYFIQHGEIYVDDFFEYEIIADQSIISFLKTIEDLIYKSGKIKNKYILQSEIIFSYYKTILNSENDDEFNGFEINDIKSRNLSEIRPSVNKIRFPFEKPMDMLLNFLQFYRTMVGISTPLIDKSGKIIAYQLLKYKKDEEMIIKKTKLSVLADLTIKAETRSLSIELIKWLTDYTQIEKLDNYIESKLTKDKIWHYLDSENNIESLINYLQKVSSNPIPNNVIEIIRSWESKYGFVQVVEGVTIILPVPGIIDSMLSLKSFSKFKIIKINENTIIVPAKDLKKFTTFLAKKNYHIKKNIL